MEEERPSATAVLATTRRAAHVLLEASQKFLKMTYPGIQLLLENSFA
jgi:hypothetical protein